MAVAGAVLLVLPRAAAVRAAQAAAGPATLERTTVARVAVVGQVRVDEEAIRVHLHTRPGMQLDRDTLDRDVRAIYAMGFFDQVAAEVDPAEEQGRVVVTFKVSERPLVRTVDIRGNRKMKREDLETALKIRPHTIFDPVQAARGIVAARKLYEEKGYLDARITYRTEDLGNHEIALHYQVEENKVVRIKKIHFEGNRHFSDRKLRRVMRTRQKWLLSPITGAGILNREVLATDMERLTALYYDNGYVRVRIDEPVVERRKDGLHVTVKIDEGDRYRVGKVRIRGRGLGDVERLREGLETVPGEVFRASNLRRDVERLTDRLADRGYAFAAVEPRTRLREDDKVVDVDFEVDKGKRVRIARIDIEGNTKTRDEVIRREMRVQEQDLFSATKLRKSREALQRSGFFREVDITTRRTARDDALDVVVGVKEAQTGSLSAGAGFSSADRLLFNIRLQENNFRGKGQRIVANADFGSIRRNIILSFTEPYFRDTPLTVGADLFNWRLVFDDFARSGTGFNLRTLYPVSAWGLRSLWGLPLEDVRVGLGYRLERASIGDLGFGATRSILLEEGTEVISSVTPRITRNTLNNAFDPTAGSLQELSFELAGLGGNTSFLKAELHERWFYTFFHSRALGDFTYSLGGTVGYGFGNNGLTGNELPLLERYFPGGLGSVRGFKTRSLGPRETRKDPFGRVVADAPIGGSRELVVNNEIIFPLVPGLGLKGVAFFDAGNAFTADEGFDLAQLRLSVGGGLRWLSPMGPLRLEIGLPLNAKPGDEKSLFLFSFGGPLQ